MNERTPFRLRSPDGCFAVELDGVRHGKEGRIVIRVTRKLPNHVAFDASEDRALEALLLSFVAVLEHPDGTLTEVVRLSPPKGAELRDVGKWALEYALVGPVVLRNDAPDPIVAASRERLE